MQYQICSPSWTEFLPHAGSGNSYRLNFYSETQCLAPPPLALPAILSFLTLAEKFPSLISGMDVTNCLGSSGTRTSRGQDGDWDNEWERCLSLGRTTPHKHTSRAFTPSSLQGIWEGIFTVRSTIRCMNTIRYFCFCSTQISLHMLHF